MAASLDTAPDAMVEWVNDLLGSAAPRARAAAAVANPRPALKAFAQRLTFSLRVPGAHPTGLAYDELLGILAASITVGLVLYLSDLFERLLGDQGLQIVSRLMGLFVCALAAQIIFTGVKNYLAL